MIFINCDMAESYGPFQIGEDFQILPYVDAVNLACGFHGGDPLTIEKVGREAIRLNKRLGAHPSFPDLQGFGRRFMQMGDDELSASIRYQIGAVKSVLESLGGNLDYVKPHGSLYNVATRDERHAGIITSVIKEMGAGLRLMAPHRSAMDLAAAEIGVSVIHEAFADRLYDDDGTLVSRNVPDSLFTDPERICYQVKELLNGHVTTASGRKIEIIAHSICIHGDNPAALEALKRIRSASFGS